MEEIQSKTRPRRKRDADFDVPASGCDHWRKMASTGRNRGKRAHHDSWLVVISFFCQIKASLVAGFGFGNELVWKVLCRLRVSAASLAANTTGVKRTGSLVSLGSQKMSKKIRGRYPKLKLRFLERGNRTSRSDLINKVLVRRGKMIRFEG